MNTYYYGSRGLKIELVKQHETIGKILRISYVPVILYL